MLAPGGNLFFVVPIGKPKIAFNAHRIYSYRQITEYFSDFKIKDFSLIPDIPGSNDLISGATEEMANKCVYGCGCFWFRKE